jgi:hypothetical protein
MRNACNSELILVTVTCPQTQDIQVRRSEILSTRQNQFFIPALRFNLELIILSRNKGESYEQQQSLQLERIFRQNATVAFCKHCYYFLGDMWGGKFFEELSNYHLL